MWSLPSLIPVAVIISLLPCVSCCASSAGIIHERNVRRMQPEALGALTGPKERLQFGQINFLHTTDTHGWLEGHLKNQNYGGDWGDFVSFSKHMRRKAEKLGVDLLIVDTGDLHDGNGLSDATSLNGAKSIPIFAAIDYDILTIGNHELYFSDVAYNTFFSLSQYYGDKYLTSNVQIFSPITRKFEYIGAKYRYFTTTQGLRIMSFGVLFDFARNVNITKVTMAKDMIREQWFLDAVNYDKPIDLFLLTGHNPIRTTNPTSTFGVVLSTIRSLRPEIPVQVFGGHSHLRDFQIYDGKSTGLESGQYCETVGWLSISGIKSPTLKGNIKPKGVANSSQRPTNSSSTSLVYSRRYLDWNRRTFAYHAIGSQGSTFDSNQGLQVSSKITDTRKQLNLLHLYGCAPITYCLTCKVYGDKGNMLTELVPNALQTVIINPARSTIPRFIILNTGTIRFDLIQGPFTYDDSFVVSPFMETFRFIPLVPFEIAKQVFAVLNNMTRDASSFTASEPDVLPRSHPDSCRTPLFQANKPQNRKIRIARRQTIATPGYTTTDDLGTDGDDTPHSFIPSFPIPTYIQTNASFPTDRGEPEVVDVIFMNFFALKVVDVLNSLGGKYGMGDVGYYMDPSFTARDYLPEFARRAWQKNMPNCPVWGG